jgi:hypothetical protein
VHLSLEIELDAEQKSGVLGLATVVGGALQKLTCTLVVRHVVQSEALRAPRGIRNLPAGEARPVEVGKGTTSWPRLRRPPRAWPSESSSLKLRALPEGREALAGFLRR